jgi:uncharacterized membrane protein YfcA
MSGAQLLLLVLAGVGAGLCGSVAGLASLVSYPVLLALGLSPLSANVTNTWGLLTNGVGSAAGSRDELRGQGRRIATLMLWTGLGGAIGAVLLLLGSSHVFSRAVPWLVALGGGLLLVGDPLRGWLERQRRLGAVARRSPTWQRVLPVVLVGIYSGYFGAGAGIMMLAVVSMQVLEPLPVSNAIKNVVTNASNGVAAVIFAFLGPVNWPAAAALGLGILIGSASGPAVVRVLPERPLRIAIAVAAFGLAVALFFGWVGG